MVDLTSSASFLRIEAIFAISFSKLKLFFGACALRMLFLWIPTEVIWSFLLICIFFFSGLHRHENRRAAASPNSVGSAEYTLNLVYQKFLGDDDDEPLR